MARPALRLASPWPPRSYSPFAGYYAFERLGSDGEIQPPRDRSSHPSNISMPTPRYPQPRPSSMTAGGRMNRSRHRYYRMSCSNKQARVGLAAIIALLVAAGCFASNKSASRDTTPTPSDAIAPGARTWLSGESDAATVTDGSFARWRQSDLEISGTWASYDTPPHQINSPNWLLSPGSAYSEMTRMDYAVGGPLKGESWAQAAAGAFDARWIEQLKVLRHVWGLRAAKDIYIRFAHEMNGSWFSWVGQSQRNR